MITFLIKPIRLLKIPRHRHRQENLAFQLNYTFQMTTVSQQPAVLKVLWIKKQASLKH